MGRNVFKILNGWIMCLCFLMDQNNENDNVSIKEDNLEETICKICRLSREDGNELYHPCKCSVWKRLHLIN